MNRQVTNHHSQYLTNFGIRLKSEREKQNLTQQALAAKAHTKQDYIAQIERGARNPSLRTLINLLAALDVSADYLIFGAGGVGDEAGGNEKERALSDFISFLSRRSAEEISAYYEIVRFLSKYIDLEK